jgi:hypothetical protein
MRKLPYIALVGLFLAMGARCASADTITTGALSFTCNGGCGQNGLNGYSAPTAGFFTYDNTAMQFLNFTITWDGITWSVAGLTEANYLALIGVGPNQQHWSGVCIAGTLFPQFPCDDALDFQLFLFDGNTVSDVLNGTFISETNPVPFPIDQVSGAMTATDLVTTTPEPTVAGLLLLGIGFALVVKKRPFHLDCRRMIGSER